MKGAFALSRPSSPLSPRTIPKRKGGRPRVPRETFGMLRLRGFRLSIFCDRCREAHSVNLVERPDLEDVAVGSVDFQCRHCRQLGHYRLTPPHRGEKPRLHEQASSCRGPADDDPTPFVGPFPMLTTTGDYLIGDFAALGFCLLATCPGGRERLIDPRDANWHHLHRRDLKTLRLRCEGCRARVGVTVVPQWYRRKGFDVVRTMTALDAAGRQSGTR